MKRLFLLLAATLMAATASAQKPTQERIVAGDWNDNWEVSATMGTGMMLEQGTGEGTFGERLGFQGNIALTKWLHPVAAVRLQLEGGRLANYSDSKGLLRWPYLFPHADVMVNLSNWIGGYREDRAYYLIPFVGFGPMWSNFSDKAQADTGIGTRSGFAMTMGLQHKFRMSPRVDFHLEMKSLLCNTDMLPIELKERSSWGVSLTAGFAYRFGRRGWDRVGDIAYTAEDLAPYQRAAEEKQQQLDEAARQNEALQKQLRQMTDRALAAEAAAEEAKKPIVEDKVNGLILFNIGHSTLDKKEQLRLEQLAEMIKQGPKEHRYKLEGYADKQTGTPEINARLAQERAKRVYDFLVEQGVDPDCLSYEGKPDENPYRRQETNRSVAIK